MTASVVFLTTAMHFSAMCQSAETRAELDLKQEERDRSTSPKKPQPHQMPAKRLLLHVSSPNEL